MATAAQRRAAANARSAIGNQAALVKGSAAAKARMAALRGMRGGPRKTLKSVRSAKAAFTRFYNKRSYKTSRARRAAMTRDLCTGNKPVVTDRRYLRSPHRYDYPGWDDGSNCPTGKGRQGKRPQTAAQKRAGVAKGSAAAKARMAAVRAARR
tara:strand:- start:1136 stop:1594 length:459 start_codon:yes stop_codon:yes gene_type:complete